MFEDTIVAPATAMVKQAISIIRMSGPDSYKIINKIFLKAVVPSGNQVYYGYLIDGKETIDQVILVCFEKPNSFTGEDIIEINCHGGVLVTNKIIKLLLKNGARLANRGEFSQRAFLNGKLNLVQTDAINDLVNATNDTSAKIALNNLQNKNTHLISAYRDELLDIIANIEVNIDYPEYDGVGDLTTQELNQRLFVLEQKINDLVKISKVGKIINEGINVLILGKPNVGKSSLLNSLMNEDKAIVSEIPGTTRDIVEGKINLGPLTLNIIDTAGLRETVDKIEQIGIEKARQQVENADLVLVVADNVLDLVELDADVKALIKNKEYLLVLNKIDLPNVNKPNVDKHLVGISALNRDIKALIDKILILYNTEHLIKDDQLVLSNIKQISLLEKVANSIKNAYNNTTSGFPVDIINVDLHEAWEILGEILGENYEDDLLTTIFSRYCLGK
ncbi:tRNA uridine-5-carboxymethylaminomethyl(34) synthesis GTPase MnmE [Spiroplasma poulsonii]|uniref:tRNA modification GTPase MnmE n=1 Tax=Spiroplasma poulsonii TaxID=2138 RepID=A0A3S0SMI1_9MOLU|nr:MULTISPECIES: tRNA uridine-5-carboxymethylaminomethyl(34) synthesis GTPase MnmE [Spiroplasma]MBH8622742.1 tRNA uridine-5-carboxymethylaminomethyl(34) synthesis GTPase MnmE [Spiroplasma sp. hyd1]MBW3058003.1 tRNA uridine-5-carboxymethylaminomethyl(34) synthesis GTPase MnmE [Spiroplasma poulsonii]RUP78125.1 tRNA uridine-5-carboxymethylaminomethyl(34) synthesis GTPase MnmE [Spiroplasma poulsonii]UNF61297.1 tRNA uridine-5-carboxymethylaminomethyl(34) synthesis GTPase MnmE [Spiroplasma poulsonii]